jgi:recombination protein RecR
MIAFPPAMQRLIRELMRLPSIGEKSATRLAYHLINNDKGAALGLSEALKRSVESIRLCEQCFFLTDERLCSICRNPARDSSFVCVVEKPTDLMAIERMGEFKGYYHVLHGLWAPLRGQGPESMKLAELLTRIDSGGVNEVVLALCSTVEGDATSLYIAKLLEERHIKASRLAQGMPKGGELEYADDITLSRALAGRSLIS